MAGESIEPSRRKHHRSSSVEDADGGSKRRKHRYHHHRHRSDEDEEVAIKGLGGEKIDEIEIEETKVESDGSTDGGGALGKVLVSVVSRLPEADYEMEEGEIVEEVGLIDFVYQDPALSKKGLDLDVESGEIETTRSDPSDSGVNEVDMEGLHKIIGKSGKDTADSIHSVEEEDGEMITSSCGLESGDSFLKSHKADNGIVYTASKRTVRSVDGVDQRSLSKSPSLEDRPIIVSPSYSHDKYLQESSRSTLSKSPDCSVGRSRSQIIARETSVERNSYTDGQHQCKSGDGRMNDHIKNYGKSSKDNILEELREHSSSRFMDKVTERHHSRDANVYRDGRRGGARDRTVEKEREKNEMKRERETNRLRDRDRWDREILKDRSRHRDREREWDRGQERERRRDSERERGRDRITEKDRAREDMYRDTDSRRGVRDGRRARSRDKDTCREHDWLIRHQKCGRNDFDCRDRDIESWGGRNSEDYLEDRPRRRSLGNLTSEDKQDILGNKNLEQEDDREEDCQEDIALQLEEQEEDDLEKIKEESRRRRQAILAKYKYHQQQNGAPSQSTVKDQVVQEKHDNQLEGKDIYVPESSFSGVKLQNGISTIQMPAGNGLGEGTPKSEISDDMFHDDIFGESPAEGHKAGKGDGVAIEKSGLHDNWDDAEGYYGYRIGEILDGQYEIIAAQGKGVFSTVVRAKDLKAKSGEPEEVAVKIIRNNDTMYKAGMEELVILKKLVGADLEDKRHCVRFLSNFKYRNHLSLVFESLHMNLREVLKKFGRNIGLKLTAVRAYAKQLFIALKHLKNCGVLHCDIKPDNILVNEAKNVLKLCDFGSAMFAGKNEITPYLVSRFYRAPEIILGLPYGHPLDIWSVGCCLFELYTGKVLFPGATNNDMLRVHMELKGPFPKKMLRKSAFTDQHFDPDLNFLAMEEDLVSKKAIRRLIVNVKPKDFGTLISASPCEDPKMVANFKDLMEKIFVLDPDKRLNVSQALSHPFITGK